MTQPSNDLVERPSAGVHDRAVYRSRPLQRRVSRHRADIKSHRFNVALQRSSAAVNQSATLSFLFGSSEAEKDLLARPNIEHYQLALVVPKADLQGFVCP
jgi:hypothetical protein